MAVAETVTDSGAADRTWAPSGRWQRTRCLTEAQEAGIAVRKCALCGTGMRAPLDPPPWPG
jgi:hypothetical protein